MTTVYCVVVVVAPVQRGRSVTAALLPLVLLATSGGAGQLERGYAQGQPQGHHTHSPLLLLLLIDPCLTTPAHRLMGVPLMQALEGDVP